MTAISPNSQLLITLIFICINHHNQQICTLVMLYSLFRFVLNLIHVYLNLKPFTPNLINYFSLSGHHVKRSCPVTDKRADTRAEISNGPSTHMFFAHTLQFPKLMALHLNLKTWRSNMRET